jgi:hypothetical protein
LRLRGPVLPAKCIGRTRERWSPLRRVAEAAGGRWPEACHSLIERDLAEADAEREDAGDRVPPHVVLLKDIGELWPAGRDFLPTAVLIPALHSHHPEMWGEKSSYGKALTAQRMGRMLVRNFKVNSHRTPDHERGYRVSAFRPVWSRMGMECPS